MNEKICSACGYRLSTFKKTGMLNCPECYKSFKSEIVAVCQDIQANTIHTGKVPEISYEDRKLKEDFNRYLKEKERAGIEGRYSDMAKINGILQSLGEELKRGGLL